MLKNALLNVGIVLGCILMFGIAWAMLSVIACVGTSLLLIVDPGMTTREMIVVSVITGGLGLITALLLPRRSWDE